MNESYDTLMKRGECVLNRSCPEQALRLFLAAEKVCGHSLTAEVEQMLGICYRLLGKYSEATRAFEAAYRLAAKDDLHRGRIMRDWSMVLLAQKQYADAERYLNESLTLLYGTDHLVEHAATMGFLGRIYCAYGDKVTARMYFHLADTNLRGKADIYELNNLVGWMKAAPLFERCVLGRRAWRLAGKTGNRKRQAQIALLIVCRPLALRIDG